MVETVPIGEYRGVTLDVAVWDGVGASTDLSAVCLFTHEPAGVTLHGGARHADLALGGALTRLRADGIFAASPGDILMLEPEDGMIAASRLLVIGLGDPEAWTTDITARAAGLAATRAIDLGMASAAFAPSLLDAGMSGEGTAAGMIDAVLGAIDRAERLVGEGLWPTQTLRHFVFDAGEAHAQAAAASFRAALGAAR